MSVIADITGVRSCSMWLSFGSIAQKYVIVVVRAY